MSRLDESHLPQRMKDAINADPELKALYEAYGDAKNEFGKQAAVEMFDNSLLESAKGRAPHEVAMAITAVDISNAVSDLARKLEGMDISGPEATAGVLQGLIVQFATFFIVTTEGVPTDVLPVAEAIRKIVVEDMDKRGAKYGI